jgi:hypothetical protein
MRYTLILPGALVLVSLGITNAKPVKLEPKLEWGKEVNGLAVSIAPGKLEKEAKDLKFEEKKVIVRWKNVGKETLELQWVRFGSDRIYKGLDDLQNHVYLKDADGKLVPARQYKFPVIGGPPYRPRTVIVEPNKIFEETIDLWTYLDKPAGEGRYQLSISLEVKTGYAPSRKGAKYWTGKVESNVIDVKVGK